MFVDQIEVIRISTILSIGYSLREGHSAAHVILDIGNAIHCCSLWPSYCIIEYYNTGQKVSVTAALWKGSESWSSVGAGLLEMGRGSILCEGLLRWRTYEGK